MQGHLGLTSSLQLSLCCLRQWGAHYAVPEKASLPPCHWAPLPSFLTLKKPAGPVQYTQLSSGQANCSCKTSIYAIIGILQKQSNQFVAICHENRIFSAAYQVSPSRQHKTTFICCSLAYYILQLHSNVRLI